jgi:hypothetical protein
MAAACPSVKCPCDSCAAERGRVERLAQDLPETITDPALYRAWGRFLHANQTASQRRAS